MALGTILAIGSLLASGGGMIGSSRTNNKIDEKIAGKQNDLQTWFDKEYNKNYFNTDQAKSAISALKDNFSETVKANRGRAAMLGSSNEAVVGSTDKAQKSYANSLLRLAGHGTQYRDALRREYVARKTGLDNAELSNLENKSQNWSNFASNAMGSATGALTAESMGAFKDFKLGDLFKFN